ncbi:PREDICTED: serine/arginine repetitive matrix protein 2 [Dinoponera quadriceps]|uniref:Microtubule-associated protein n=1 Tax=Dinoponera quadriceps TaxID=609295 RepID=A0A6P3WU26_DINQU|nr:PREDICTED: serine/arginine repetitive matrix protein 2 [Dinoponera quadriceps]
MPCEAFAHATPSRRGGSTEEEENQVVQVKPNTPLPPQGFQARSPGPPLSPRNSINNGPIGAPRPGPQPLRRLDSRSSLGPPASGQFVQLRPYGPPRPPGGSFPPRPPQPGQLPPQNQRFAYSPGIRGPPPPSGQRSPFVGNYQQARGNEPRFQRPAPDIAAQNGPPRNAEAAPHRPGQDTAFPRQLLRNDSALSLQRQHLSSNEEIKQPTRPRIVVERMADINETTGGDDKPEAYLQGKKLDVRENVENDDDDDVVMDNQKSPRHDANSISPEVLVNGSKSPSTPRKHDDAVKAASRPGTAEKQDVPSKPISANSGDKVSRDSTEDAIVSQSRPSSAVSGGKDEGPTGDSAKSDSSDKSSRPPSAMSIPHEEEVKQPPGSPYGSDEQNLRTPSRTSDNSRSSTPSQLAAKPSTPAGLVEPESRTLLKTPDKSRSSTPAGLEPPQSAGQESRTPEKSRSSTPAGLEPPQSAGQESRTPEKSRSSTPAGLEPPQSAGQESRTPEKSRSSTPAGLEPPQSAEQESRTPEKSSIPANLTPSPQPEPVVSPAKTPEKPADSAAEPSSDETAAEPGKLFENSHRDKSGEDTLQVKESSRPASSLDSPDMAVERDSKSPSTPESQGKLSALTPPRSPEETVKGFDNGRQRSLSSRMSPGASPRSPNSPKSPGGSAKEGEKKRTSFAEDTVADEKAAEAAGKTPTSPSKPSAGKTRRATTPAKLSDEKAEPKSSEKKAVQNGSASESQADTVPTTNGVAESPTKKSKESDKRSTAGSPTKSPSKSAKSVPRTPETPPSTAQEKKKLPMNKIQVGAAPSPNLKTVRSKIGSLDNASYKPGGGKVKIENRKLDFSKAQPKIAAKNEKYTPSGGDKKIAQQKLQWNAKSKVGSLENATYKPGGGDKKIETVKLDFKDKAKPKVGSKDNAKHMPGGGAVKSATPPKTPQEAKNDIPTQKIDIKAESKIGSLDNMKHKPGGGDKKIFNDRDYLRQTSSNVESLNGSGSQAQTPVEDNRPSQNDSKANDTEMPQPPPSTPTRVRHVTSPSSVVTPRAVRNGLAKSPDASTPRRQLVQETEGGLNVADERSASKTPSPDATEGGSAAKSRSPRSPRPPSSLRVKSASDRSSPRMSPSTPSKTSPGTPRKTSPRELRLPKLASSPTPQEASPAPESHSKITLPKLIEPSSQAARMAY